MGRLAFSGGGEVYQALYRKYRPRSFDDVVGQKSVTDTLKAQLVSGRLSHAYLFTGTRGTGKTSCAKILARAVNCENPRDGNPCNVCPSCRSIAEGRCMDVLEIDAASNNGVDNVRTLRDEAVYTPAEARRRVYIIDEVHMLSTAAFNALLKIVEEPPEHLIFILATTEVHKVPATILSRCQRFSFRRLLPEDIAERLQYVAEREEIDLAPEAARVLARLADGALRDGLSLLDQCASAGGALNARAVYERLGLAGSRQAASLLAAVAERDTSRALSIFSTLYAQGKDVSALLDELCALARDLLILKTAPKSGAALVSGLDAGGEEAKPLRALSAGELLRITSLLQKTASGFAQSADRRLDAELCLLALCAPSLQMDAQSLNARLNRLEQAAASGRFTVPADSVPARVPDGALEEEPAEEVEEPPADEAGPVPARPPAEELPLGFWPELNDAVAAELAPGPRSLLKWQTVPFLRGGTLELQADSEFTKKVIEPALGPVQRQAEAVLGRHVSLCVTVRGAPEGDLFQNLVQFGMEHRDLVDMKTEKER